MRAANSSMFIRVQPILPVRLAVARYFASRGKIALSKCYFLRGKIAEVESSRTSLASRPQVLENWPVLGSRTAVFFELLKFCEALEKFFGKRFFVEIA